MKKSFFTPAEVTKFKKLYPVTMNAQVTGQPKAGPG